MKMSVDKILRELETKCKLDITYPALQEKISRLKVTYPMLPKAVLDMYQISDGIEINDHGTVIYSIDRVSAINHADSSSLYITIGCMSFGDEIVVRKSDGRICQIDHETASEYLEWNTFEDLLADEIKIID